jgi:hypothetical protein
MSEGGSFSKKESRYVVKTELQNSSIHWLLDIKAATKA